MKRLVIEVVNGNQMQVQIQTHRGKYFGDNGDESFKASNGCFLASSMSPAFYASHNVYVRGTDINEDGKRFFFRGDNPIGTLRRAVREYNEYFKDPEVEYEVIV